MINPKKAERLAPLMYLQTHMIALGNITKSNALPPNIVRLIGFYLLMPTRVESLAALVTLIDNKIDPSFDHPSFHFDVSEIKHKLRNTMEMKDSEQEVIDKIYKTSLSTVIELIGDWKEELLREAARTGDYLAAAQLLKIEGINVNAVAKNKDGGSTALMCAAKYGDERIVAQLLMVDRIDVNVIGNLSDVNTALMMAATYGREHIVAQLLSVNGIDVNMTSNWGYTALMWAAQKGYVNIVGQLLRVGGIDVKVKCTSGATALRLAAADLPKHKIVVYQLCIKQLLATPFEQSNAILQQLQDDIQTVNKDFSITAASLYEHFLLILMTTPKPEQIPLLEKALSKDNAFSALMGNDYLSQIRHVLNMKKTENASTQPNDIHSKLMKCGQSI